MISMRAAGVAGRRALWCLVPSYIQDHFDYNSKPAPRKFATSSLDGLRGVAALIVFIFHILFSYTAFHEYGYGQSPEQTRIIQLPILRLFYSGHAMVAIFFVVGGYVFSLKPLKLMRSGQSIAFLNTIVSSVFRRAIRLFMPAIIATFLTMMTLSLGLWEPQRKYITDDRSIIWYADNHIERASSIWAQLADWLHQTKLLTNVFTYYNNGFLFPYYPHYDPHLWTIPVEYRSSIILAMCLLGLSQCRPVARLCLEAATVLFCISWDRWELVCFLGGSMLCEIDMATDALSSTTSSFPTPSTEPKPDQDIDTLPRYSYYPSKPSAAATKSLISSFTLIAGLYLLSYPPLSAATTPGYTLLSRLIPSSYTDPKRFPHTLGALLLLAVLTRSPWLQRPFDSAVAQYLGQISFALYISHGPVIHMVSYRATPWLWQEVTGMESSLGWTMGLAGGGLVTAVVVAVVADWLWRVVEGGSGDVGRWLERVCFVETRSL